MGYRGNEGSELVQKTSDNGLKLSGMLDCNTIPLLAKSLESAMTQITAKDITLDLAEIDSFNTAGLACLVNCAVAARNKGQQLLLQNVPANVLKLAKLSDVDTILGLQ